MVPSYPYRALKDLGAYYLALFELVGPINFLHLVIALGAMSSIPREKSEVMNPIRVG